MPVVWALSIVAPIFKCSCYRAMKVVVRVFKKRLCRIVPGRRTVDAVFILGRIHVVSCLGKKVGFAFCGPRKSF